MDTGIGIDSRIGKALLIPLHGDGIPGADAEACSAAGAVVVVCQLGEGGTPQPLPRKAAQGMRWSGRHADRRGRLPCLLQPHIHIGPVHGIKELGGIALAHDPIGQTQAAENAEGAGMLRLSQFTGATTVKKGTVELHRKYRAVEGIVQT